MELTVHLYELGLMSAEKALEVLGERIRRREPIGKIAVARELLTVKDVMRVLAAQADDPAGLRFGEMAISLGLLTLEELEWLLREQTKAVPSEMDLAMEVAGLDRDAIERALRVRRSQRLSAA